MAQGRFGWCFIGSGRIVERVLKDLPYSQGAYVATVYSPNYAHAQAFAQKAGAIACKSLEEAVSHPDVRAVYVGTPHAVHMENTIAALELGKPVLCEKPFALNRRESQAMIDAARASSLYLMEGMWMRFNPAIRKALSWIESGRIGRVLGMRAEFAFRYSDGAPERLVSLSLGGGALLDVGVYTVALSRFVFGAQPTALDATATFRPSGVDGQCALTLCYDDSAIARLYASLDVSTPNDAHIYGDKGSIYIPDFALPERATLIPFSGDPEVYESGKPGEGFQYEFDAVMEDILAGKLENALVSHQYTLDVMETLDATRARIGLVYPQEG
ncbi:Gfo/Idh/MocA family oxidoreductase [Eubacteriales bacterium OttesenSCG-928-A19]|nr:Gfo/Idh/MocA family oxidoreductase [Eubacteriales bacterium OttesenSCG-928-A19]